MIDSYPSFYFKFNPFKPLT